ncbi:uncharacterized protein RHOBADRAFT_54843 [Rhodotorula graminis WP1]|uniref:Uncharacterized protein n=1 Tax=Rhodotorula graminis (strain WP1) TaxID=578459 RepID=A0A0P9EWI3_RHOGW|nr:uncharacterized protein RHOBADRAFT_54843 [Rhodotorula graminis WP1]KPV73646.1 hypothetical protein RHOBADRAFT_54843 [Rhodotorula graminis WP1]
MATLAPAPPAELQVAEPSEKAVSPALDLAAADSPITRPAPERTVAVFREVLDNVDEPIPTYDELERFGLFDLADCARRLAEYRLKHPVPATSFALPPPSASSDSEAPSTRRPRPTKPHHRHSVAIVPLSKPSQQAPPLASPSLAIRVNPFNLVRRTSLRPRPSRAAKSTGDVPLAPTSESAAQSAPQAVAADAAQAAKPRPSSRLDPAKENRGARKLRKQAPPKITLRTDDEYLLRPFAEAVNPNAASRPALTVSVPTSAHSPRPTAPRRQSWRSGTSSFVSSPLACEPSDDPFSRPRSPSPVATFPSSVRRETLPPVERKKRDSSMSSSESVYLADNERTRLSPRVEKASFRFSVGAPPSPTGSASSSSVWSRALKLSIPMGRRSGSRPSSVASFDSPVSPVDDSGRSFEVLGRRASPRPAVERAALDATVVEASRLTAPSELSELATSASAPNLSRIVEQPEQADKRASLVSTGSRSLAHAASSDSLPPSSGVTTPAVVSASSSVTIRDGTTTPSRPALPRSRGSSNLVLASSSSSRSLASAYANAPASAPPLQTSFPSTSSLSLGADSWHSSPSSNAHSRSHDSLFYSGSEMHRDGEDEFTGASSAQDDDDDVFVNEGRWRRSSGRKADALPQVLAAPVVVDQGHFVHPTIGQAV